MIIMSDIDNIVKRIDIDGYTYILGYDECRKQIYPKIEIYENKKLAASGGRDEEGSFYFDADVPSLDYWGKAYTIQEMFIKLRESNNIPEEVEREYERIYLIYKLNGFNEL